MSEDREFTVVFVGHPKNIKGNPFDVVSDFGTVQTIGIGNAFETADSYREALDQIAEGFGKDAAIAQAAIDAADAETIAALKALKARKASPQSLATEER